MTQCFQNGRVSLYGSYWNLANSAGTPSSGIPSGSRQSPFSQYNSQQVCARFNIELFFHPHIIVTKGSAFGPLFRLLLNEN